MEVVFTFIVLIFLTYFLSFTKSTDACLSDGYHFYTKNVTVCAGIFLLLLQTFIDGNVLKLDSAEPGQHQNNKAKQQQKHCLQHS